MRRSLLVALAVAVAVNAAILLGAARNRAGEPDALVVLDERELFIESASREDSAMTLRWRLPSAPVPHRNELVLPGPPLDVARLERLGFDCSVRPGDPAARAFYRATLPRLAIVVLEVGGERWERRLRSWQQAAIDDIPRLRAASLLTDQTESVYRQAVAAAPRRTSRLFPVDVGLDAGLLRGRYPDSARFLVLPGLVRLVHEQRETGGGPVVYGHLVQLLPAEVAVPRHARAAISGLGPSRADVNPPAVPPPLDGSAILGHDPRYRVRLAVGRRLQPWVVEVGR